MNTDDMTIIFSKLLLNPTTKNKYIGGFSKKIKIKN